MAFAAVLHHSTITKCLLMLLSLSFRTKILNHNAISYSVSALSSSTPIPSKPPSWTNAAIQASDILSKAQSILFVTGAGISAESGLPTYRGVSGLYNQNNGITEENMTIEDCLSGSTYRIDPQLTWKYLLQIETACRNAQPSRAHSLLAHAEDFVTGPVTVMTQNVDGLHDRAGSSDVLSLHGELYKLRCTSPSCGKTYRVPSYAEIEMRGVYPPLCTECGNQSLRPNVVLFDEYLGDETVERYERTLGVDMGHLIVSWQTLSRPAARRYAPYDVSVCIGTSALFGYVNGAALSGKHTIEINPTQTFLSELVDVYVPGGATEVLEFMYERLGWL